ncbi:uncharacterized protein P174DRAFT_463921 [Aspergillus novofumigatus IBT 16806]|uniref:Integral membrane protein n=1 Tax=Aspergillus novofumigatus (strain IBT 16806) TaxID=1392255 RepID=A0A2I1BYQ4_ASPN1|nr:uncharacterized protein P174DRAFT_463921 [Aspergillus novofumigatus IBT 16806]PKX90506.1 hypothetical protein P174DRAFT_463921 [Aspergillus novofumigatus IBT 16806]
MAQVEGLQVTQGYLENPTALTVTGPGMGLCWLASYAGMIRKSFQDRSYCMPLMPLGCNLTSDFIFSDPILQYVIASWLAGSVMMRNILWIFAITILGWVTVYFALAAQFGPDDAFAWSACFSQLLLGAGSLCQVIVRGSSRAASFFICLAALYFTLRFRHGHVIWHSPLAWWGAVVAFLTDSSYGILLWHIQRSEGNGQRRRKAGSEIGPK